MSNPAREQAKSNPARDEAVAAQARASNPAASAFVAASAGSGKTKLLTDRLLRLMLAGEDPAGILCLTYTKAAAAEMAIRLQTRLGKWVTSDDAALDLELAALAVPGTDANRGKARALFADVLDLPGGMRISTIHAFCQSLLRRFPLEAQLTPHFRLIEETDANIALTEAREDMLAGAHTPDRRSALNALAGLTSADGFGQLVARLQTDPARLRRVLDAGIPTIAAAQARVLGATETTEAIIASAVNWQDERAVREAFLVLARDGSPAVRERATRALGWLALRAEDRAEHYAAWHEEFFRADGPRGAGALVNKKLADSKPALMEAMEREQSRLQAVDDRLRAIDVARLSAALFTLAAPVADAYANRKDREGLLDYNDLIGRTSSLLIDPGAAWVLYKLDGGLDHLLLDEVQDTAPAQWQIAGALTADFFTGLGARDTPRTIFAVGDRKQSIFSFQGADPESFETWRARLRQRAQHGDAQWEDVELRVSFRSTTPVLALVDHVFATHPAAAGVAEPGTLRHLADRAGHAGSVELWPLAPEPDPLPAEPWQIPDQYQTQKSATQRLAEGIADWIAAQTDGSVQLQSQGRPLTAGDVLVLVRRRNAFAEALVRALKIRKIAVAGLDRMTLTAQPAVADLMTLCDALLLPADDLAIASVLTGPLGGLDDNDLIALAPSRSGSLWDELRRRAPETERWQTAHDLIAGLLARVDYVGPHALLAEILGPLGGRHRLLARLGPEAAEPIDELLNAALLFAANHPPSLQGFLHWLRQSGAQVKREAEGAGDAVRIMTVHSAKGLQAPVVILPDTTSLPPDDGPLLWATDAQTGLEVPLWAPRKDLRCAVVNDLRADIAARRLAEHNRLLYVALTRAEDRLVVCGVQTRRPPAPECWYELVRTGFVSLAATATPFPAWDGEALSLTSPQIAPADNRRAATTAADQPVLPAWAGHAPHWHPVAPVAEPALPSPLAPSRPENAGLGPVPEADSPLTRRDAPGARFQRGHWVHSLLQHLPALPAPDRIPAAYRFLDRPGHGLSAEASNALVDEVMAVLDHPDLAPLFGPEGRAEVPLTGVVGTQVIGGLVDRLAVLPDRVLIADYKTNRRPPTSLASVPLLYLRQLAAYRAVLRLIYPDRPVHAALVWTAGPTVTVLPDALLDRHSPAA